MGLFGVNPKILKAFGHPPPPPPPTFPFPFALFWQVKQNRLGLGAVSQRAIAREAEAQRQHEREWERRAEAQRAERSLIEEKRSYTARESSRFAARRYMRLPGVIATFSLLFLSFFTHIMLIIY